MYQNLYSYVTQDPNEQYEVFLHHDMMTSLTHVCTIRYHSCTLIRQLPWNSLVYLHHLCGDHHDLHPIWCSNALLLLSYHPMQKNYSYMTLSFYHPMSSSCKNTSFMKSEIIIHYASSSLSISVSTLSMYV